MEKLIQRMAAARLRRFLAIPAIEKPSTPNGIWPITPASCKRRPMPVSTGSVRQDVTAVCAPPCAGTH